MDRYSKPGREDVPNAYGAQDSEYLKDHPLFGPFDTDPGRWRPRYFGVEIAVGVNAGNRAVNAINIDNQPFVFTRLAGKIVGETADPSTTGLYQDGQWDVEMRDESSVYTSGPIPGDLLMGGPWAGYTMPLEYPLPYPGNKVMTFTVINRVNRVLASAAETFVINLTMSGVSDWGELWPQQPARM